MVAVLTPSWLFEMRLMCLAVDLIILQETIIFLELPTAPAFLLFLALGRQFLMVIAMGFKLVGLLLQQALQILTAPFAIFNI